MTRTASRRPMSRRRFMVHDHTGRRTWEGASFHMFARWLIVRAKAPKIQMVSSALAPHPTFSAPTKCIKGCRPVFPKRTTSYRSGVPLPFPANQIHIHPLQNVILRHTASVSGCEPVRSRRESRVDLL
jgi:hypothetical protein